MHIKSTERCKEETSLKMLVAGMSPLKLDQKKTKSKSSSNKTAVLKHHKKEGVLDNKFTVAIKKLVGAQVLTD